MTAVIQIENLKFRYPGAARDCLSIPSFRVEAGDRVFLHGPSGSGKSTLLGLLGGVLLAQQGAIRLLDQNLNELRSSARDRFRADHIGFLFQQFNLIPYLSTLENVLLPCQFSASRKARALKSGGSLKQEAQRLMMHLDMDAELWQQPVNALSVGQQQRVAAARALMGSPEIIIADEPTSALDADRQNAFIELLMRECAESKTTLIFVSHDQRLASAFTHNISLADINTLSREVAR